MEISEDSTFNSLKRTSFSDVKHSVDAINGRYYILARGSRLSKAEDAQWGIDIDNTMASSGWTVEEFIRAMADVGRR